jgi:hypothetical protein
MANQNPRKIMLYMPLTLTPPYKAANVPTDALVPTGIPRRLGQYRFPQQDLAVKRYILRNIPSEKWPVISIPAGKPASSDLSGI